MHDKFAPSPRLHTSLQCDLSRAPRASAIPTGRWRYAAEHPDRCTIKQECFLDETCAEFAGQAVLFVSDIRTADWIEQGAEEHEQCLIEDNARQRRWVSRGS